MALPTRLLPTRPGISVQLLPLASAKNRSQFHPPRARPFPGPLLRRNPAAVWRRPAPSPPIPARRPAPPRPAPLPRRTGASASRCPLGTRCSGRRDKASPLQPAGVGAGSGSGGAEEAVGLRGPCEPGASALLSLPSPHAATSGLGVCARPERSTC